MNPWKLAFWPGVITLAITLLRLLAELQNWDAALASDRGGGDLALIGISWFMFPVGAWMGWKLARAGDPPTQPGRALATHAIFAVAAVLWFGLMAALLVEGEDVSTAFPDIVFINGAAYTVLAIVLWRLSPQICRVMFAYGVLARVPVIVITCIAVPMQWGTHYERIGPGDGLPGYSDLAAVLGLSYAQALLWVPITMLFGGLVASVVTYVMARRATTAPSPSI